MKDHQSTKEEVVEDVVQGLEEWEGQEKGEVKEAVYRVEEYVEGEYMVEEYGQEDEVDEAVELVEGSLLLKMMLSREWMIKNNNSRYFFYPPWAA